MIGLTIIWRLRTLAFAALALAVFGAIECPRFKLAGRIRLLGVAVISAKNHKRHRRNRQSVTTKREKSQTPKILTAILTLHNLT